jgi:hypothetical protein
LFPLDASFLNFLAAAKSAKLGPVMVGTLGRFFTR